MNPPKVSGSHREPPCRAAAARHAQRRGGACGAAPDLEPENDATGSALNSGVTAMARGR